MHADLQPGNTFAKRIRVRRAFHGDVLGTFWHAEDTETGQPVVLRTLDRGLGCSKQDATALAACVRSLAGLQHANVVLPTEMISDGRTLATISPDFEGRTLEDLRAGDPQHFLRIDIVEPIAHAVAHALDAVRKPNLVHGGLRPGNIFISPSGQVYVADFGIGGWITAAALRSKRRDALKVVLPYLSRALLDGQQPYLPDDVYAFGAIFYEALAGLPPVLQATKSGWGRKRAARKPILIAERRKQHAPKEKGEIPPTWEHTILSCLDRDGFARPQHFGTVLRMFGPAQHKLKPIPAKVEAKPDLTPKDVGSTAAVRPDVTPAPPEAKAPPKPEKPTPAPQSDPRPKAPIERPNSSAERSSVPTEHPSAPAERPSEPAARPATPVERPAAPVERPTIARTSAPAARTVESAPRTVEPRRKDPPSRIEPLDAPPPPRPRVAATREKHPPPPPPRRKLVPPPRPPVESNRPARGSVLLLRGLVVLLAVGLLGSAAYVAKIELDRRQTHQRLLDEIRQFPASASPADIAKFDQHLSSESQQLSDADWSDLRRLWDRKRNALRLAARDAEAESARLASARSAVPTTAPTATATLTVSTVPIGATVEISGRPPEKGPVLADDLAPGKHTVTVRADGYATRTMEVELGPAQSRSTAVTLERLMGRAHIESTPTGLPFEIEDKAHASFHETGTTPADLSLPTGDYELVLTPPEGDPVRRTIAVQPKETATASIALATPPTSTENEAAANVPIVSRQEEDAPNPQASIAAAEAPPKPESKTESGAKPDAEHRQPALAAAANTPPAESPPVPIMASTASKKPAPSEAAAPHDNHESTASSEPKEPSQPAAQLAAHSEEPAEEQEVPESRFIPPPIFAGPQVHASSEAADSVDRSDSPPGNELAKASPEDTGTPAPDPEEPTDNTQTSVQESEASVPEVSFALPRPSPATVPLPVPPTPRIEAGPPQEPSGGTTSSTEDATANQGTQIPDTTSSDDDTQESQPSEASPKEESSRLSPSSAPTPPAAPRIYGLGEVDTRPKILSKRQPDPPRRFRRKEGEGRVRLVIVIDRSGFVSSARVISSTDRRLSDSCLKAIRYWRFRPARKDGETVSVVTTVPFVFK